MGPLRGAIVVTALSVFCDRSSYAFTALARTKPSNRAPAWGLHVDAGAAASPEGITYPGKIVAKEQTEHHLRHALPGVVENYQLQEALARCEVILCVDEAAGIKRAPETPSCVAVFAASENEDEDAFAGVTSPKSAGPVDGLRRFSRDGADGVFMGAAGVPVRYRLFPKYSPEEDGGELRPGVVLLTGLMESMVKYGETIAHLNDRGFSVYTYDHHGQGLSGRLPVPEGADPTVAHITDFDHYVHDLVHFSKAVLPAMVPLYLHSDEKNAVGRGEDRGGVGEADVDGESSLLQESGDGNDGRRKLSVVAHSMGGLIAVKAALQEPLLFDGIVLAAPMLAPNTGKLPNGVVGAVAWAATKLSQGHRSPIRRPARATMEWSKVTHDRRRLRLWETLRGEVNCVLQRGPSFTWLGQAIRASKRGWRSLDDLSVPVLVLEAGLDRLVRSDGIERFRRRVPQARYRLFGGAYHDLFDETDDIRIEVLRETCSFLENLSGRLVDSASASCT